MSTPPPPDAVDAIEAGITQVTRRVEFYEADGVTPYYPNGSEEDKFRLLGGSVSIDSSRDERRTADMTLDNRDNKLRPQPNSLWYDKIIKPYRGVRYPRKYTSPRILIAESTSASAAALLRGMLINIGFKNVAINLDAATIADLRGYDVIISDRGYSSTAKATLLQQAYTSGYKILTKGVENGVGELPFALTETMLPVNAPLSLTPVAGDNALIGGWSVESEGTTGNASKPGLTGIRSTATPVAYSLTGSTTHYTAVYEERGTGKWFAYQPHVIGTQAKALWVNAIRWLWGYTPYGEWETPLGEFLIDNIKTQNYPNSVSISMRDQTKKLLGSKVGKAMSFSEGTRVADMITALAANAGIKKIRLSDSNVTLSKEIAVDRATDRFSIIKQAADFMKSDAFFDNDGYLTLRPWADPTLGAPMNTFKTGDDGNLSSFDRSTNDSRIYNHIFVTGEPTDAVPLGFYGEAVNNDPASPTSVQRLGDRGYFYTSSFFTSDAQCLQHASQLLGQTAFEQYEISFNSLVYPWIESGVVIDFFDPDNVSLDPTRFLMDTASVPLDLSPMSGTGKRVLYINGDGEA